MDTNVPIGYDGFGAPLYTHQIEATPIVNARDCELGGYNLADVLEAAKTSAP